MPQRLQNERGLHRLRKKLVGRVSKRRLVSGHDFSRAADAAKSTWPLGPEGCLSGDWHQVQTFFRSLFTPEGGFLFKSEDRQLLLSTRKGRGIEPGDASIRSYNKGQ